METDNKISLLFNHPTFNLSNDGLLSAYSSSSSSGVSISQIRSQLESENKKNFWFVLLFIIVLLCCLQGKAFAVTDLSGIDSINQVENNLAPISAPKSLKSVIETGYLPLSYEFSAFDPSKKTNLKLYDTDVPSALRILAAEGGKNIVIDETVKGTVTAELKNVSLNEAMKTILVSKELEARIEGNTIYVASRPAMAKKGLNRKYVKAFKLNNSNAVYVAKILEASVFNKGYQSDQSSSSPVTAAPQAGAAQPQATTTNQSILTSNKIVRGEVPKIEAGEGFADAKILAGEIKINHTKSEIQNIEVSNNDGGAIVIPDTRTNSVIVAGLRDDIIMAENAINYLDKPLGQVEIQVSLVEINRNKTKNTGLSFMGQSGKFRGGFDNSGLNTLENLTSAANQSVIGFDSASSWSDDLNIRLNALLQDEKAKLLANPKIIAQDNSESLIKITDQVVSKMEVVVTQTTTTYDVTLADVGIVLNILPKIATDGTVTMQIRPSVTTALAEKAVGTFGAFVTPISTREVIIENVKVKSGETLAIAGLIKEGQTETKGKVPVLSDIPALGKIFTTNQSKKENTELVILITPKIVGAPTL